MPNLAQCCEKCKETGIINRFFYILHGEYLLKQKVVVVHTPEGKFKANITGNVIFEECLGPNVCLIWVKNGKKLIIFKNFNLVSLKSHKIDNIISVFLD